MVWLSQFTIISRFLRDEEPSVPLQFAWYLIVSGHLQLENLLLWCGVAYAVFAKKGVLLIEMGECTIERLACVRWSLGTDDLRIDNVKKRGICMDTLSEESVFFWASLNWRWNPPEVISTLNCPGFFLRQIPSRSCSSGFGTSMQKYFVQSSRRVWMKSVVVII